MTLMIDGPSPPTPPTGSAASASLNAFTDAAFQASVVTWRNAGWKGVLRLPPASKAPPPYGYTGADGIDPDTATVGRWFRLDESCGNIAIHLPGDIVGLDFDSGYIKDGVEKQGGYWKRVLEEMLCELPPTARSSARGESNTDSGICLYRLPEFLPDGRRVDQRLFADKLWELSEPDDSGRQAPIFYDIEIIRKDHRYMVAAPSTNPENGQQYRLYDDEGGGTYEFPPRPDELPFLPDEWCAYLMDQGALNHEAERPLATKRDRSKIQYDNVNDEQPSEWLDDDSSWYDLLTRAGWSYKGMTRDGDMEFVRPGKDPRKGGSARVREGEPRVRIFSASAALGTYLMLGMSDQKSGRIARCLSKLDFLAAAEFGGNVTEAARWVGLQMKAERDRRSINVSPSPSPAQKPAIAPSAPTLTAPAPAVDVSPTLGVPAPPPLPIPPPPPVGSPTLVGAVIAPVPPAAAPIPPPPPLPHEPPVADIDGEVEEDADVTLDDGTVVIAPHAWRHRSLINARKTPRPKLHGPWGVPWPLKLQYEYELPTFPVDVLPPVMRDHVLDVSKRLGASIDLVATTAFGAMATMMTGRVRVQVRETWYEPANLFLAVIAPPGGKKSPAHIAVAKAIPRAVDVLVREARETNREARLQADQAKALAVDLKKRMRTSFIGPNGEMPDDSVTIEQVADAERDAERLAAVVTPEPRLYTEDIKPERLAQNFHVYGGRQAVVADEPTILTHLFGLGGVAGNNYSIVLKGKDGGDYIRQRTTRDGIEGDDFVLPEVHFSACIGSQPYVMQQLLARPDLAGTGLVPRFQFVCALRASVEDDDSSLDDVDFFHRDEYEHLVTSLTRYFLTMENKLVVTLSEAARELHRRWTAAVQRDAIEGGLLDLNGDGGAYGIKQSGEVARIASLLAGLRGEEFVSLAGMTRAIRLNSYFVEHTRFNLSAPGATLTAPTEVVETARSLRDWLMRQAEAAERDPENQNNSVRIVNGRYLIPYQWIERTRFRGRANAKAAADAVGLLVDRGWVRMYLTDPDDWRHANRGPKPEMVELNPDVFGNADARITLRLGGEMQPSRHQVVGSSQWQGAMGSSGGPQTSLGAWLDAQTGTIEGVFEDVSTAKKRPEEAAGE